jgi:NAD(P)H-dependent flavin oxidoreductase YrpB (nitropropane dioxygenase family)
MTSAALPRIIQGGMGVAVSSWRLANRVSRAGGLGVVSGTALDIVVARRLQDGDPDGDVRRALAAFPVPEAAAEVLERYFIEGGKPPGAPYRPTSRPELAPSVRAQRLIVVGNFVEVWLAREGHDGKVGSNYLEKIQLTTPAAAYGAMLAGVDAVLMGAGIPAHIPAMLDDLAAGRATSLPVDGAEAGEQTFAVSFDPAEVLGTPPPAPARPTFLAIVSGHVLAAYLARSEDTRPDGFVVEAPTAGGHNAPPRGKLVLDDLGQPVYGPRDAVDTEALVKLDLPFWMAGSFGSPDKLREALALGASGIQVGTLFALSRDSGFTDELREALLDQLDDGALVTRTDAHASPTGFPFKVAQLDGTLSDPQLRAQRTAVCDLGHLRQPFLDDDGEVDYRCPAEPIAMYVRKGGDAADAEGRVCLCNALCASVGIGQVRKGAEELPLVTLGDDLDGARALLASHPDGWTADVAVRWLEGQGATA